MGSLLHNHHDIDFRRNLLDTSRLSAGGGRCHGRCQVSILQREVSSLHSSEIDLFSD